MANCETQNCAILARLVGLAAKIQRFALGTSLPSSSGAPDEIPRENPCENKEAEQSDASCAAQVRTSPVGSRASAQQINLYRERWRGRIAGCCVSAAALSPRQYSTDAPVTKVPAPFTQIVVRAGHVSCVPQAPLVLFSHSCA
jgi:hypothetical protein